MLDLRPKDLTLLHDLMARHLPTEVAVWTCDSRVNGNNHESSNLDLVLRTPDLQVLPAAYSASSARPSPTSTSRFLWMRTTGPCSRLASIPAS